MKKISGILFVFLFFLTAACGSGGTTKADPASPKTTVAKADPGVTLASIGGDKLPLGEAGISIKDVPKAPAGYTDTLVRAMGHVLIDWAKVAALDPKLSHSASPIPAVTEVFPGNTQSRFSQAIANSEHPRTSAANVFPDDVKIVGTPHVTSSWKVGTDTDKSSGMALVTVILQTRVAYQLTDSKGESKVIGVVRQQQLASAGPATGDDYLTSWKWEAFGSATCASYKADRFVPTDSAAQSMKELTAFKTYASATSFKPLAFVDNECKTGDE